MKKLMTWKRAIYWFSWLMAVMNMVHYWMSDDSSSDIQASVWLAAVLVMTFIDSKDFTLVVKGGDE